MVDLEGRGGAQTDNPRTRDETARDTDGRLRFVLSWLNAIATNYIKRYFLFSNQNAGSSLCCAWVVFRDRRLVGLVC